MKTQQCTILFVFAPLFWVGSLAQIIYRGKCPTPKIQEDFNATMFSGRWYEDSRSFALFQLTLKCVETDFEADHDGRLSMKISGVDIIGENRSFSGKLEIKNLNETARMRTRFRFLPMTMNYIVLHTDYNNTAVIWSCHNLFSGRIGHLENLWVLSRSPKLPAPMKHELYDLLDERGVKRQFLQSTDQSSCRRPVQTVSNSTEAQNSTTAALSNTTLSDHGEQSLPGITVVETAAFPESEATSSFSTNFTTSQAPPIRTDSDENEASNTIVP